MKWKIALFYNRPSEVQNVLLFVVISVSSNCFLSNFLKRGKVDLACKKKKKGQQKHPKVKHHFPMFSYFIALRKQEKKKPSYFANQKGKLIEKKRSCTRIFKMSTRSNSKISMFSLTFSSLGKKSLPTKCFSHQVTKYPL